MPSHSDAGNGDDGATNTQRRLRVQQHSQSSPIHDGLRAHHATKTTLMSRERRVQARQARHAHGEAQYPPPPQATPCGTGPLVAEQAAIGTRRSA